MALWSTILLVVIQKNTSPTIHFSSVCRLIKLASDVNMMGVVYICPDSHLLQVF
jgi:hypothetical protein